MPVISSTYRAPYYLPGGTLQTLIAARLPRPEIHFQRETLELKDGDFLDLDWQVNGNRKLIIVTHGLEGSSHSQYTTDMSIQMDHSRYDLLAWNCRSCSGRMNRLKKLYYHGEIEDISEVIEHVLQLNRYDGIYLAGFSMGGNISIKFLSEKKHLAKYIVKCGAVSSPCDLSAAANAMDRPKNYVLRKYFMRNLRRKLAAKEEQFPGSFPMEKFDRVKTWREFDALFSAPFNGFNSVEDFYFAASANNFIDHLKTPTLLINAKNDPVLEPSCNPVHKAEKSPYFFIELPRTGGHVYFPMKGQNYAVRQMLAFFQEG
jgi:predicted alpha/beta-fold hydrolase